MKHLFTLYISLLLLASCSDSKYYYKEALDAAEPLVWEQPYSAIIILKNYSLKEFENKADRARFALIYSEALLKNKAFITSDSLAGYALEYYSRHGNDLEKARAYIAHSHIDWYANNTAQSIEYALKAKDYLGENDHRYNAQVSLIIGKQYFLQRNYHKAMPELEEAVLQFGLSGDTTAQMDAYMDIGALNLYMGNHEKSYDFFKKCYEYALQVRDTSVILHRRSALARAMFNKSKNKPIADIKKLEVRKFLFEGYKRYNKGEIYSGDLDFLVVLYGIEGKNDSALLMLQKWEEHENKTQKISRTPIINHIEMLRWRRNFQRSAGKYQEAIEYDKTYDAIIDSLYFAEKKNAIQQYEAAYKHKLDIEKLRQSETERSFLVLILIISLFAGVAVVLWLISRHRMSIFQKEQQLDQQQEILTSLTNAKFELEQRLKSETLLGTNDGVALENLKKILGRINVLIEKTPRNKNENIKEQRTLVYDIVNRQYNGILDYLQKEYNLSQYELELCSMICMGFSNSSIRILLDHTNYNTIYNYRSSLKNKLGLAIEQQSLESFFGQVKQQLDK